MNTGVDVALHDVRWGELIQSARIFATTTHGATYLAAKRADFTEFTRGTLLVTALFMITTIAWDFAIDPVNAPRVIWLRCLESALVLLWALASWRNVHAPMARVLAMLGPLGVEATFVHILGVLHQGASFGMGGFLYFFIFMPFLTLVQPLAFSVAVLVLIAVFPPVLGACGVSADLDWWVYAAYVGLVIGPVMLILLMFEYLYWTVFRYREQVEVQAVTDGLTRVANRRHFMAEATVRLSRQNERGGTASLLFIDIDRFKAINDAYGHALGDQVLTHVVVRLRQVLRDVDLIARYGGEEFVVLLSDTDTDRAVAVAERMRQAVRAAPCGMNACGQHITSTVSIGIATHRAEQPADLDRLIADADRAVYEAKRAGRDRVVAAVTQAQA
ncbi:GGDEF domain-containing protein [Salinisphaera sp. LB1]|uniref:GGDEF domain-containing protein n=1 Tax=Salinisphaera sp. LB1 TaxID=2183911 RepID=UPI000D70750E|nr:GGDEF domain-containing protein [Salinisphaera sp. LB1]